MSNWCGALALFCLVQPAAASTLKVFHDHDPFGRCSGELTVSEDGIEFHSEKSEHSRRWDWVDVQSFDRLSPRRFSILTWEDQFWKPGGDRSFDFSVPEDAEGLDEATFGQILRNLKGWVTDRIPRTLGQIEYSVPVKHLHALGGCQGRLRFGADWVVFESEEPGDSRSWRRGLDVESFWSPNPYLLEVHVFEENAGEFSKTRRYRFRLKERLDRGFYLRLRRETLPPD